MPLDQQDSAQLNYKAKIRHYQARVADLQSGFVNPVVAATNAIDPDQYISNLNDLGTKISNLITRVNTVSAGMQIPVDVTKEPGVAAAVAIVDPTSNGAFISYETYTNCLNQINSGIANLNVEALIANASQDPASNSQLVQSTIYNGYATYAGTPTSTDATYDDTISTWGGTDGNIQQVVNFANNYLSTYPDPTYTPWAFSSDLMSEQNQCNSLTNLWNGFSSSGSQNLTSLGGALQNQQPLTPNSDIAAATDTYLSYVNDTLNNINNLLNSTWEGQLLTCFVNFNINLDLKTIEAFILVLQLLKTNVNFDFKDLLSSFENVLSNMMRNLIINELLNILLQVSQRVITPIENWLATEEQKISQLAGNCPLLQQLVQTYLAGSIDMAEAQVNDMIVEFMKSLELKKIQSSAKISQAGTNNWISQAVTMMREVSQVMQLAAQSPAGTNNPQSNVANQIIGQLSGPTAYAYPVSSSPNIYNTFPTTPQQVSVQAGSSQGSTPLNMPAPVSWTL